jgi:D-lactate dehydrogenase
MRWKWDRLCKRSVTSRMCLFSPNTDALIPLRSRATSDRAPDHLADGTPPALRDGLIALLGPAAVLSRVTDLVKYATDASPYRLFPQVVVVAESLEQIAKVLQYAKQNHQLRNVSGRGIKPERSIAGG